MKPIKSTIVKFTLAACCVTFLPSCNKGNGRCENWEYQDFCTAKTASARCYEYANRVSSICNAELDDANTGRTSIIYEDADRKIERHYIRPAN